MQRTHAAVSPLGWHLVQSAALRALVPALLATAAIVVGGVLGFLLGFGAALLAIDRLLDRTGAQMVSADQMYLRLARERRRGELARRLLRRPSDGDRLEYLADDSGWAAVSPRRRLGVQAIAIDSIVGTSDRRKASSFDSGFRPPTWSRGRWTQMCLAAQRGTEMPPISVYRVGERHYVRDGHHRVSVARALGAAGIEAHVVELRRR